MARILAADGDGFMGFHLVRRLTAGGDADIALIEDRGRVA